MNPTCLLLALLGLLATTSASAIEFACEQAGDQRYLRVNMPGDEHLCEVGVTYPGGSHRVMWYADNDTLYCSAKLYELRDKYIEELGFACSGADDRDGVDSLSARHRYILDTQLKSLILRGRSDNPAFEVTGLKAVASNRLDDQPGALALQFFLATVDNEGSSSAISDAAGNQLADADSVDAATNNTGEALDEMAFGQGGVLPADRDRTQVIIDEGNSWRVLSTVEDLASQVDTVDGLDVHSALIESVNDTGALQINTLLGSDDDVDGPAPCHGEQVIQWQTDGTLRPRTPHRYICTESRS